MSDIVIIQLDKPRELRYGHKALKKLVALTGKSLEDIERDGFGDFDTIEKMVYCGLNDDSLQLSDMEQLLDKAPNYKHIIDAVQRAFLAAFGVKPEDVEGNQLQPAQEPEKAVSTGTKA